MSIPKIIHYCWFGDKELPNSAKRCINSWRKKCPGFIIKKWSENNIDFSINRYTRQAYEMKAWGFVPDYLRLWIIYNYGGIYLDTDVQVVKDLSPLCDHSAFAGLETPNHVALGLGFGAESKNQIIFEHMELYEKLSFIKEDGGFNKTPSPHYTTELFKKHGFQQGNNQIQYLDYITIYPTEYFCPKDFETGITKITKNTYSIHHFDASWYTELEQQEKIKRWRTAKKDYWKHFPNRVGRKILGAEKYNYLKRFFK